METPTAGTVRSSLMKRSSSVSSSRAPSMEPKRSEVMAEIVQEKSLWQVICDQFNGNEGAGLAISFVVHLILLMVLAVPVLDSFENEEGFTTLVDNAMDEHVIFDAPLDTLVAMPETSSAQDALEAKIFDPTSAYQEFIPELKVDQQTALAGEGDGTGNDGELGGGRVAEPENAVRAGNFSVWNWPIFPGRIAGQPRFGTPGESPKIYQSYFIVIRIKAPKEKKFVRLSDFSGSVVGTDGYRQKIPDDAYFFRANGDLMKARSNMRMPVIDGTAELLIKVPGASYAEVKDTIRVYSRIIDEEQEIELVFQSSE